MVNIENGLPHHFEKQNLTTLRDRKGTYDVLVCSKCGLKGKSRQLGKVWVDSRSEKKIKNCDGSLPEIPKEIQITWCHAQGKQFANLTPGSIHETVTPPSPYVNDFKGVWVMGVGEPVKVLKDEYVIIKKT